MSFHRWLQNLRSALASHWGQGPHRRGSLRAAMHRPSLEVLEDRSLLSTFTVLNLADSGEGSLRQAVLDANVNPGPDAIDFADGLHGTIPLTGGQLNITGGLTINGPGADRLTVSGNHRSRIFGISGGATVALIGLTITGGRVVGDGGGILNTGGTLALDCVVLSDNQAVGASGAPGGNGGGGAIANLSGAALLITDSAFTGNQALGGAGGQGNGAAILNFGSRLTVSRSTFSANQALGAASGGSARGGGIDNTDGSTATVTDSTFVGNQAVAGDAGGRQAFGRGGGLYNFQATLTVANCTFVDNLARGGSNIIRGPLAVGGIVIACGAGAGVFNASGGILAVTGSTFTGNRAVGGSDGVSLGGNGTFGAAFGAGLHNSGETTVTDCVFEHNEARGGSGNRGDGASFQFVGTALGGAISNLEDLLSNPVSLTLDRVTLRHNRAVGGDGNTAATFGGVAIGGGLMGYGINGLTGTAGGCTITLRHTTVAHNEAVGGSGETALGGGVANLLGGVLTVSSSTISHNRAQGGESGSGFGGGLYNGPASTNPSNPGTPSVLTVEGSSLAHNAALGGAGEGGARGGDGLGGGLWNGGVASIHHAAFVLNRAVGGDGAAGSDGGNGSGGAILNDDQASVTLRRSLLLGNWAMGGDAGAGGSDGEGIGGGAYSTGTINKDRLTLILLNYASTRHDNIFDL